MKELMAAVCVSIWESGTPKLDCIMLFSCST